MTFLYIFYVLLAIIVILLVIALYLPNGYFIEKHAIIKRPRAIVMDKVADLHYYAQWNPWLKSDADSKGKITGTPKTPGHKYIWEGKKIGVGSLTLRDIDEKHVFFELQFIKPYKARGRDNWIFEEWGNGNETKVTWQDFGDLPYPHGRLLGYLLYKSLNRQFNEGLLNLRNLCEK
jgi:hypothetical protein